MARRFTAALLLATAATAATAAAACETLGGLSNNGEDIPAPRRDSGPADPIDGGGGGGQDTGPIDTTRCDPTAGYGAPQLQTDLDGAKTAKGAVMTSDGLEIFYLREASPWDLRHGRRASRDQPWEIVTDALSPAASSGLSLAVGGLKLYFWNFDAPQNGRNLYGTRTARGQPFVNPQNLIGYGRVLHVVASDDSAYFADYITLDGGSLEQLVMRGNVINNMVNSFKTVDNLHEPKSLDSKPVLNESETIIYFSASNRPNGAGADDIYVSRRPSKQSSFGAPTHPAELNSAQPESVTWVADDDCEILIDRASHIYRATRPPLK